MKQASVKVADACVLYPTDCLGNGQKYCTVQCWMYDGTVGELFNV